MTYLAPEIVTSYFVPNLYDAARGFTSAGVDGDGKISNGGDDA